MKLKYLLMSALCVMLIAVSCSKEEENMTIPSIKLETSEVAFSTAASSQTVEFMANRAWTATWDSDWIAVEPISGEASDKLQTITITVLNNAGFDRTGNVKITMTYDYKTIAISQTGERGSAADQLIFSNDFDKEAATQSYGTSGSSWPYLDQFEGWKNEKGKGAEGVTYDFKSMSCRNNSNSNGNYSDYAGSGTNNLLFASGGYFSVQNITLTSGIQDYTLSFGTERYLTTDTDNTFKPSEFHVYISEDNTKWVELTYTFPNGFKNGRWDKASTTFTVPSGTTNLSVYFKSDIASGHRLDDVKLEASVTSGTEIDFSTGIELNGGGGGGGGSADAIYFNNFDKEVATQTYGTGNSWPYAHQFDGWKNEKGSGVASVKYTHTNISCRANSQSNGSYSVYEGSGSNNLFFGASKNVFKIKDITLSGQTKLSLTFGTEKYQQSGSVFNPSEFHVYVGKDTLKWVELSYSFPNGNQDGKWDLASTTFQIPSGTTNLCFYITADVASAYRLDDVTLSEAGANDPATAIDFANGISLDDNGGGGGGGGGSTTLSYKKVTTITSGKAYLIVAGSKAAKPITSTNGYGYLYADDVTVTNDKIEMSASTNEFTFTAGSTSGQYTIAQSDGKLLYMTGTYNSFNVAASPASGQYWTVSFGTDGTATITNVAMNKWIQWSGNYSSFGSYNSTQTNSALPVLYEKEGDSGSGGGGGGGDTGGGDANYDVVVTIGSSLQTWAAETNETYGAGFSATASGLKIGYYKHTSSSTAVTANADHIRVYKNSVLVITPTDANKKIKSVKLETTGGANYCSNMTVLSDNNSTATASGTSITWSNASGVASFVGHAVNTQVRVSKISVEYAD